MHSTTRGPSAFYAGSTGFMIVPLAAFPSCARLFPPAILLPLGGENRSNPHRLRPRLRSSELIESGTGAVPVSHARGVSRRPTSDER